MSSDKIMKGLPRGFPDVNDHKYWAGLGNANPDGLCYAPSHTVFYIRDYMKDVKAWFYSSERVGRRELSGEVPKFDVVGFLRGLSKEDLLGLLKVTAIITDPLGQELIKKAVEGSKE